MRKVSVCTLTDLNPGFDGPWSLNPEDANCGKAAANLAYIRPEFGTESGILSGVEERSPFGSKVALPPINPTPNSVPVFGTEFGAVFRPAYYILI